MLFSLVMTCSMSAVHSLETSMLFSLVMTCFLVGGYSILPRKDLHRSLQVYYHRYLSGSI